ncbi:MAG: M15 family metallopeptidase [Acidobacteriota bacterium]|nr:M15 family metallopeptidase [Acidobacteriota bacterium]
MNFYRRIGSILVLLICLSVITATGQTVTRTPPPLNTIPKATPETNADRTKSFLEVLAERLSKVTLGDGKKLTVERFCPQNNIVTRRILSEYGAIFVGDGEYRPLCYFTDENHLQTIQRQLLAESQPEILGGVRIELQPAAMEALLEAVREARRQGLAITPRGGSMAARRSFADTVGLWSSRVNPGLNHWVRRGRLSAGEARQIRSLPLMQQVAVILELEDKKGIYFSTDFSKSILYSVAMPGASQHNWMLALDVAQFGNPRVREILARHGWFQTVYSDLPHFTYLGVKESDPVAREKRLRALGLHSKSIGNQVFWIPRMDAGQQ